MRQNTSCSVVTMLILTTSKNLVNSKNLSFPSQLITFTPRKIFLIKLLFFFPDVLNFGWEESDNGSATVGENANPKPPCPETHEGHLRKVPKHFT